MSQTVDERRVVLMVLSPTIHVSFRQLVFTFASGQQAYWYAGWNEEGTGKHCSLYLGKEPPDYHPCFNHRCGHAGSKRGPRGKRKLPKAIALLQTLLQSGPRREREVWEALQRSGCSFRTYHRARQELGVEVIRVGLRKDGWWELNLPTTTAFFDRWTPELAWVTGLIWGRGCLHGNTVEIHRK